MSSSESESLEWLVGHLAHRLPAQGPIGVFVHHNTLHAFQHLPFEKAVVDAARIFRAEPYLAETAYRAAHSRGRIRDADIDAVLRAEGVDVALRRAMLLPGVRAFGAETIRAEIETGKLIDSFRSDISASSRDMLGSGAPDAIFRFWLERVPRLVSQPAAAVRPRDGILHLRGTDIDDVVHPLLIKLAGAYLDQGLAYWPMPNRDLGFWRASLTVLTQYGAIQPAALRDLHSWAEVWASLTAERAVETALSILGVDRPGWHDVLEAELLALPGWAGLMHQLEEDPSLAPHEPVPATLMDFLAVRLLLTVAATSSAIGDTRAWRVQIPPRTDAEAERLVRAARLFDVSQVMGFSAEELSRWTSKQTDEFMRSVEGFDDWERRRVWHVAYERRHERQILLPLRQHAAALVERGASRPVAQIFFCLDEREESLRRHVEELDEEIETFGAAGYFGVAMRYEGIDDPHGVALCPVVVTPQHEVTEEPAAGEQTTHHRRQALRRAWAMVAREASVSSRTLMRGWLGTSLLGVFSLFPLAARVLSPRRYARLMPWLNESVLPEPRTELAFMRSGAAAHDAAEGLLKGFTASEKAERVASVLGPAGLRGGMARLVVILGHGSSSLNNPHESAHDCGACGGRRGGPNARVFAAMANRPEVRERLREHGVCVPDDTWFVGAYHDTCNDDIDYYDLETLPPTHVEDLERVRVAFELARARNAHERARRFEAAPDSRDVIDGLHHVQERAEHLAEPRPEYGHCTNAVCIVGRRSTTRGLFFDRRAFLASYDATQDPDDSSLASVLSAAIPVCAGISLEYYFSFVDNERYGCGTKLPHNVTGLMGVMNGYEGDLRTGLPWQMVEIHEPVRILFVIETTPERALETIRRSPVLWQFLSNRWIRLAVMDPADGTRIRMYRGDGVWEPVDGDDERLGEASSSFDWYNGRREHIGLARIAHAAAAPEMEVVPS